MTKIKLHDGRVNRIEERKNTIACGGTIAARRGGTMGKEGDLVYVLNEYVQDIGLCPIEHSPMFNGTTLLPLHRAAADSRDRAGPVRADRVFFLCLL